MPVFQAKARTADTYLAGIGASGALIAGAFVTFMVLVGAVTFDAWPRAASLIGPGDGQVSIGTAPTSVTTGTSAGAPQPTVGAGPATVTAGGGGQSRHQGTHGTPGTHGSLGGNVSPPGGTGGQTPVEGTPPSEPPSPQPRTIVGQTVSTAGNTVQSTTDTVGNVLGGSNSPVGGTVDNLGQTLNGVLQGVANNL